MNRPFYFKHFFAEMKLYSPVFSVNVVYDPVHSHSSGRRSSLSTQVVLYHQRNCTATVPSFLGPQVTTVCSKSLSSKARPLAGDTRYLFRAGCGGPDALRRCGDDEAYARAGWVCPTKPGFLFLTFTFFFSLYYQPRLASNSSVFSILGL